MSEDEISALVGNRAATLLFLWPRSMAGRFRKRDGARRQDEAWPGLQLSTRAAIVADVEQAINQVKQGSDWFSRVAAAIASGAGQGLLEGLIWLVTRQALSLGLPDHWSPARLPPLLEVGPLHRCVRLTPSLGMRPRPGTSGPLERFRGAVRLGWIDPELLKVLLNSDLRTPTSLVRFSEPWPDVSDLDALDVSELVGRVDGTELVGRLGKLRPTYVLLDAEGKVVDIPQDSVPLQLAVDGLPREEGTDAGKDRRSVLAAELVAASLVTRGLEPNDRLLHFQHRLQCRATFELWPLVEQLAARHPERDYSTIFAALLWAQQVWTGMRPASPAVAQFLVSKPYSWLGRTFWALFRLANPSWDQSSPAHDRKVLKRALREGGTHPVAQLLRSHKRPNGGR